MTETSKRGFRSSGEEALVMARPEKYPDELIARGVRLALESGRPIAASTHSASRALGA